MSDNIAYEEYTLVLKHELIDGDKTYQLDEPLIVKYVSFASPSIPNPIISNTYLLNEMMDKLKHELIRVNTKGGKE